MPEHQCNSIAYATRCHTFDDAVKHMHTAAVAYLEFGFSIVPFVPGAKQPAVRWKRFQTGRLHRSLVDEFWLHDYPGAGIAVVLGPLSNLFAIDVDGPDAHRVLTRKLGKVSNTPMVQSGSGKPHRYHLLFQHPNGIETKAKATPWHPALEFRGNRGLLIAPPSLHPSGNRYRWAPGQSLDELELPDLPDLVSDSLQANRPQTSAGPPALRVSRRRSLHATFAGISINTQRFIDGEFANAPQWNDRLFRAACDLAGNGVPIEMARPALLTGAGPWNLAETDKAMATIDSAYSESRRPAREFAARHSESGAAPCFTVGSIVVRKRA